MNSCMVLRNRFLYIMLAQYVLWGVVFSYMPLYGMELTHVPKVTPYIFARQTDTTEELYSKSLKESKNLLFSRILEVTEAEPNEVQRARDWLATYLDGKDPSPELRGSLELVQKRLLQPEALLIRNQVLRDSFVENPSSKSDILAPLRELIGDIDLLRKESSLLDKLFKEVHLFYQRYISVFDDSSIRCAEHIRSKVILTGEEFLDGHFLDKQKEIPSIRSYRISQEMALTLLSQDTHGFSVKSNKEGSHPVSFIASQKDPSKGVHFKEGSGTVMGLQVGKESALYRLWQVLFKRGAASSALLTLNEVDIMAPPESSPLALFADPEHFRAEEQFTEKRPSHVLQASDHVAGISLEAFIEGVEQKEYSKEYSFDNLDVASFSEHIIMSILTNPSDGKPDNFMVSMDSKPYKIVCIDNDMALGNPLIPVTAYYDTLAKKKVIKHNVQVKNVLYCLPLMEKLVDEKVMNRFLRSTPEQFILQWLSLLEKDGKAYEALLSTCYDDDQPQSYSYLRENDYRAILGLPVKLSSTLLNRLKRIFEELQTVIRHNQPLTHWQLCLRAQPLVARFYKAVCKQHENEPLLKMYEKIHRDTLFVQDVLAESLYEKLSNEQTVKEVLEQPQPSEAELFGTDINSVKRELLSQVNVLEQPASYINESIEFLRQELKKDVTELSSSGFFDTDQELADTCFGFLHESWRKDYLLIHALSKQCPSSVISFLLHKLRLSSLLIDEQEITHGWSVLRHAVAAHYPPTTIKLLIQYARRALDKKVVAEDSPLTSFERDSIVQYRLQEWLNHQSDELYTVLDEVLKQKNTDYFICLIDMGCTTCKVDLAWEFYRDVVLHSQNEELSSAFIKLAEKNKELGWKLSLEYMLPSSAEKSFMLETNQGKRSIFGGIGRQILNNDGQFISCTSNGNRLVAYAKQQQRLNSKYLSYGIYFKVFPELPGIEEAVGILTRLLLGFGAPHVELVKAHFNKKIYPVILSHSHGEPNDTLGAVLSNKPEILNKLDEESVSGMILVAMLVNPEDGKPDNYVIEPHPLKNGRYRIVGIDNDHAFVPAFVKDSSIKTGLIGKSVPVVQVKTVIYCLDQMNNEIASQVRQLFIKLRPDEVLKKWLNELEKINDAYGSLFTREEKDLFCKNYSCYLQVPFQKGEVSKIYDKLLIIRDLLIENPHITHIGLLSKLEPYLAKRYKNILEDPKLSVLERFEKTDKKFYKVSHANSYTTVTETGSILCSFDIPYKESISTTIDLAKNYSPKQALKELEDALKERNSEILQKSAVFGDNLGFLVSAQLGTTRVNFLSKLDCNNLTDDQQKKVLVYLKDKELLALYLKNCKMLTDDIICKDLSLKNLTKVDLNGCTNITTVALYALSNQSLALSELNLAFISTLKKIGYFKGLKTGKPLEFACLSILNLMGCQSLKKLLLNAPKLTWLNIEGCTNLSDKLLDKAIENCRGLETLVIGELQNIHFKKIREKFPYLTLPELKFEQFPLHIAVIEQNVKRVEALIKAGMKVDIIDGLGYVPLLCAIENNNDLKMVQCLLKYGANPNFHDGKRTLLHYASERNNLEIVKEFITKGADLKAEDSFGDTPLHYAFERGTVEIVKYLVEKGANLEAKNHFGSTPLHNAYKTNQLEKVELLIKEGADLEARDNEGRTPISYVSALGYFNIVKLLIEKAADYRFQDFNGATMLHHASEYGNTEIVKFLIEKEADINANDKEKITPLHLASGYGNTEIVKLLIDKGADINAKNCFDETPLLYGFLCRNDEVVKFLLHYGACYNVKDRNGGTLLFRAIQNKSLDIVKILIKMGASLDVKDGFGVNPPYYASMWNDVEIVKLLVKNGADASIFQTSPDIAKKTKKKK